MALGNLASRALVAVIAVPVLIFAMYFERHELVWGLVFVASGVAMYEFFAMHLPDKTDRVAGVVLGLGACAILYWVPPHRGGHLLPPFVAVVGSGLYYVFRFGELPSVAARVGATVTGILYGGVLFTFVALLKRHGGGDYVLLVLGTPWISDTGAYFAGRFLGKRKLYPALSPGKTWAGAVGGLCGAVAAAAAVKALRLQDELTWVDVAVLGLAGGALCQVGDLFESMIKRSRGVKDSGTILRGHGGMLDRVDAVLWFAPFVFLYMTLR